MHIAIVADPRIPVPPRLYGGIERIVHMLVSGLVERGHEVTLFAHENSRVPCRHISYTGTDPQAPWDTIRNTFTVSQLAFERPDVIHSFGRLAYLTSLLPTGTPKIMSYQRAPTLSRVRMATRLAREGSLIFTGCSEHIAKQVRPVAPSHVVYNGVPVNRFDFRERVAEDAPLVFLGRIAPIKGTHHAIRVAQNSDRRLVIAGNVPDAPKERVYFEEKVKPHVDGEQVRYVGPVDDEEKNGLLGRAAALLMPIDWEEPFGIVMAEAMACGTPVIGTRRGAVPEVVDEGVTGFIGDEIDDLINAVRRIDRLDRTATRERCQHLFSDQAVVDGYEEIYCQQLA